MSLERAARIARIEALQGESSVSRIYQRLIEPASWGWLILTFLASSLAMGGMHAVAERLPHPLVIVLTGLALYLSVRAVDELLSRAGTGKRGFAPTSSATPETSASTTIAAHRSSGAGVAKILSWTIRTIAIALVLAVGWFAAIVLLAPESPLLARVAAYVEEHSDGIRRDLAAEPPPVRGRSSGANWRLQVRDGRYVAEPFAAANRLCAALGSGWRVPRLEDFERLSPPPDEPTTLHVWMQTGGDASVRASSAQIGAGSWRPSGFVVADSGGQDRFLTLCVHPNQG